MKGRAGLPPPIQPQLLGGWMGGLLVGACVVGVMWLVVLAWWVWFAGWFLMAARGGRGYWSGVGVGWWVFSGFLLVGGAWLVLVDGCRVDTWVFGG